MWKAIVSPSTFRLRRVATSAWAVAAILLCNLDVAFSSDENDSLDPSVRSMKTGPAKGRAYLDLPMRLRARFGTSYTDPIFVSDPLAEPYAAGVGPDIGNDHALTSRIALTHSISDKIEIGIVWGTRNPLTKFNFFDFEGQTVGALIRIVP